MARPGTENHGTEKYWHGPARKILARKNNGTAWPEKKYHKLVFLGKIILGRKIRDSLPGSKIPLLAIHKIISHIYGKIDLEKLIMTNPVSDFFTETFDLLSARPFENLVFRPESQGGQISGSPELVGTLPQALFFFHKKGAPYFWKPLACGYVAAGAFFSTKKSPIFLEALPSRTARIHQIWARIIRARHGNPPPPVKGGTGVFFNKARNIGISDT